VPLGIEYGYLGTALGPVYHTNPFLSPTTMTTSLNNLRPNIGVFTDPQHNLWLDTADPPAEDIQSGAALADGEVVVEIRSTGICGYVRCIDSRNVAPILYGCIVQTCISGMPAESDPWLLRANTSSVMNPLDRYLAFIDRSYTSISTSGCSAPDNRRPSIRNAS